MVTDYDGVNDRRRQVNSDHDLLIRIEGKLDSSLEEIKSLKLRVGMHDKFIYIGIGGIAVIEFISKVLIK